MSVINTNTASLMGQKNLGNATKALETSLERLSSGLRINSAKDDAAGLAISNRFTAQIRGSEQAVRNSNDAISMGQIAEGALKETNNMLQRMKELALQSANGSNGASDRANIDQEVQALKNEITRIAQQTTFNGLQVLNGDVSGTAFQVGDAAGQTISMTIGSAKATDFTRNYTSSLDTTKTIAVGESLKNNVAIAGTETFEVNGTVITPGANADMQSVANSINAQSASTGVTASAKTEAKLSSFAGGASFSITSDSADAAANRVALNSGNAITSAQQLADEINRAGIGFEASVTASNEVTVVNYDGLNFGITMTNANGGSLNVAVGTSPAVTISSAGEGAVAQGTLTLSSNSSFTVKEGGTASNVFSATNEDSATISQDNVASISVDTVANATSAINVLTAALDQVADIRANIGASQNRFESTVSNLHNSIENLSAARSRIEDADFARETANMTRGQILQQAGVSVLGQANNLPQNVLGLLQ